MTGEAANRGAEFAVIDCRSRIGPQFSDPQRTIVRTPARPVPDWRLRRSCENKCSRVAFAKDTDKVLCLRWLSRIASASDALSRRRQPVLAQTGLRFPIVEMTAEITHQMT